MFVLLLLQLEGLEIPTSLGSPWLLDKRLPWRAARCGGKAFSTLTVIPSAQIKINEKQSMRVLSYRLGLSSGKAKLSLSVPENTSVYVTLLFSKLQKQT